MPPVNTCNLVLSTKDKIKVSTNNFLNNVCVCVILKNGQYFWKCHLSNLVFFVCSLAKKTSCGEDAQRSHKQQHSATQNPPPRRAPSTPAKLEARESWHPRDSRVLPERQPALGSCLGPRRLSWSGLFWGILPLSRRNALFPLRSQPAFRI